MPLLLTHGVRQVTTTDHLVWKCGGGHKRTNENFEEADLGLQACLGLHCEHGVTGDISLWKLETHEYYATITVAPGQRNFT